MMAKKSAVLLPMKLVNELGKVQRVVVLTGAAMSAESGIPSFQSTQNSSWAKYDPKELATLEAFQRNPSLVWEWHNWQRELVKKAEPNPGHLALVEMQDYVPEFTLITQNVDGLHQRADSKPVIELYGNLNRAECINDGNLVDIQLDSKGELPHCPDCGGLLRPKVVWSEESPHEDALNQAMESISQCDLFFIIGISSLTQPANSLALKAFEHGAKVIEISSEYAPLPSHVDTIMYGEPSQILPALMMDCLY